MDIYVYTIYIYVYVYVYVCIYIYIYVCIHIYIYIMYYIYNTRVTNRSQPEKLHDTNKSWGFVGYRNVK